MKVAQLQARGDFADDVLVGNEHVVEEDFAEPGVTAELRDRPHGDSVGVQIERTQRVRRTRDNRQVRELLEELAEQARDPAVNLMPVTIEAVKARATRPGYSRTRTLRQRLLI